MFSLFLVPTFFYFQRFLQDCRLVCCGLRVMKAKSRTEAEKCGRWMTPIIGWYMAPNVPGTTFFKSHQCEFIVPQTLYYVCLATLLVKTENIIRSGKKKKIKGKTCYLKESWKLKTTYFGKKYTHRHGLLLRAVCCSSAAIGGHVAKQLLKRIDIIVNTILKRFNQN